MFAVVSATSMAGKFFIRQKRTQPRSINYGLTVDVVLQVPYTCAIINGLFLKD